MMFKLDAAAAGWLTRLGNRRPGELLVARSVPEMRALRAALDAAAVEAHGRFARVGFVPTMGALHAGHLSLCDLARAGCYAPASTALPGDDPSQRSDFLVASVFVNPTQFAPHEDLSTYPRTWDADCEKLAAKGGDAVFAPTAGAMYPPAAPHRTFVELAGVDGTPEGAARPGFFRGVATVVTKLLAAVTPTVAAFGQKDGIQCVAVKALVRDLNLGPRILIGPTQREPDGLAMSSRNVYLSPAQRAAAPAIYRGLARLVERFNSSPEGRARVAAAVAASASRLSAGAAVNAELAAQRAAAAAQAAHVAGKAATAGDAADAAAADPFLQGLLAEVAADILREGGGHLGEVQYLRLSDALTGAPIGRVEDSTARGGAVLLSTVVKAGATRLLDNVMLVGTQADLGEPPQLA